MYTAVYQNQDWVDNYNEKYKMWIDDNYNKAYMMEIKYYGMKKAEVGDWFPVGITTGLTAVDGPSGERKAKREAQFPLTLTDIGTKFRSRNGEASVKEDRLRILKEIGTDNTLLDERVHSVVATAALSRVLKEQDEQRKVTYLEAIRQCSPPELLLDLTSGEADEQETMSAVFQALAFRDGCKMLELTTKAPSIPGIIGKLTALQTLKLYCGSLTSLPEAISGLTALQTLDLEYCHSLTSLPEAIGGLTTLQTLNLQDCSSLMSLPEAMGGLTALQTLSLSGS